MPRQRTIAREVACSGVGVHSGAVVRMRLLAAEKDEGVKFIRTDLKNGARTVKARWDSVTDTRLCTVIGNDHGGSVATIEHFMAAVMASAIDNLTVEIDGPEVPVMDGSADPFMFLLDMAGSVEQDAPRREIIVTRKVEVVSNGRCAALLPSDTSSFSFSMDFGGRPMSGQSYGFDFNRASFRNQISRARTFGFFEEIDHLRKLGFARGGSLDNAIVIKDGGVMNEGGLRYEDEFVRHKLLDAVGDLALAAAPIRGKFHGDCSGHAMNNMLLRALFASQDAWRMA